MIGFFLFTTFFVSWVSIFALPLEYADIIMYIPAAIAIIFKIIFREKIWSLFKLGALKTTCQAILATFLVIIFYLFLSSYFGFASYRMPEASVAYFNGDVMQAWIRFLVFGAPLMLSMSFLFAIGEEIGWRGYLLEKLGHRVSSFLKRSLLLGLIWGIWHVPIYMKLGSSIFSISIFLVNVCLISIVYSWLFEQQKSIWPTVCAHAVHNTFFNALLPIFAVQKSSHQILFGEEGFLVTLSYGLLILIMLFVTKYKVKKYAST